MKDYTAADALVDLGRELSYVRNDYQELNLISNGYIRDHILPFLREAERQHGSHLQPIVATGHAIKSVLEHVCELIQPQVNELDRLAKSTLAEQRDGLVAHRSLRRAFRQIVASTMCSSRYQAHTSSVEGSTFDLFAGFDQIDERSPFAFNYSRWHSSLVERYEKRFVKQFASDKRQYGMLVNSGMASISLAFDIIDQLECKNKDRPLSSSLGLFYFKGIHYGEATRAILRFADRQQCKIACDCTDTNEDFADKFSEAVEQFEDLVPIVYFDLVSPRGDSETTVDFRKVVSAVEGAGISRCYLVIDVTRTGPIDAIHNYFHSRTCDFRLFEVESLAKYHLYGQDYIDAGMLRFPRTVVRALAQGSVGKGDEANALKILRANDGFSIPDYVPALLPTPDKERFVYRHNVMCRNAEVLWLSLKHAFQGSAKVHVSFPGDDTHPFFEWTRIIGNASTLVHFKLSGLLNTENHRKFLGEIRDTASKAGLIINVRGSYGFDHTALDLFPNGWTRVSAGTEDCMLVQNIADHVVDSIRSYSS